jgi:hypothetical protein
MCEVIAALIKLCKVIGAFLGFILENKESLLKLFFL